MQCKRVETQMIIGSRAATTTKSRDDLRQFMCVDILGERLPNVVVILRVSDDYIRMMLFTCGYREVDSFVFSLIRAMISV